MGEKNRQDAWYVNLIMGFVALVTAFLINKNYEKFMYQYTDLPSGKGGKAFELMLKRLDDLGGKPLVLGFMAFIAVLCFWWAYRKYQKRNSR